MGVDVVSDSEEFNSIDPPPAEVTFSVSSVLGGVSADDTEDQAPEPVPSSASQTSKKPKQPPATRLATDLKLQSKKGVFSSPVSKFYPGTTPNAVHSSTSARGLGVSPSSPNRVAGQRPTFSPPSNYKSATQKRANMSKSIRITSSRSSGLDLPSKRISPTRLRGPNASSSDVSLSHNHGETHRLKTSFKTTIKNLEMKLEQEQLERWKCEQQAHSLQEKCADLEEEIMNNSLALEKSVQSSTEATSAALKREQEKVEELQQQVQTMMGVRHLTYQQVTKYKEQVETLLSTKEQKVEEFEAKNAELTASLESKTEEITTLESKLKELMEYNSEQDAAMEALKLQTECEKCMALEDKVLELTGQLADAKSSHETKIHELKTTIGEDLRVTKEELHSANNERNRVVVEYESLKAKHNQMEIDYTGVQSELETAIASAATAHKEMEEKKELVKSLGASLQTANKQNGSDELYKKIVNLEQQIVDKDKIIQDMKLSEQSLIERMGEQTALMEVLQKSFHENSQVVDTSRSYNEEVETLKRDLENANNLRLAREAELGQKVEQQTGMINTLQEALLFEREGSSGSMRMSQDILQLNDDLTALREKNADLTAQLATQTNLAKTLSESLQKERDEKDNKSGFYRQLGELTQELEETKEKMQEETHNHSDKVEEMQQSLQHLQDELTKQKETNDQLQKTNLEREQARQELESAKESGSQRENELREQLASQHELVQSLKETVDNERNQAVHQQMVQKELDKERVTLIQALKSALESERVKGINHHAEMESMHQRLQETTKTAEEMALLAAELQQVIEGIKARAQEEAEEKFQGANEQLAHEKAKSLAQAETVERYKANEKRYKENEAKYEEKIRELEGKFAEVEKYIDDVGRGNAAQEESLKQEKKILEMSVENLKASEDKYRAEAALAQQQMQSLEEQLEEASKKLQDAQHAHEQEKEQLKSEVKQLMEHSVPADAVEDTATLQARCAVSESRCQELEEEVQTYKSEYDTLFEEHEKSKQDFQSKEQQLTAEIKRLEEEEVTLLEMAEEDEKRIQELENKIRQLG